MSSTINASTTGGGGVITTADASGSLNIQSGGTTVVAVTSAGAAVTGTLSATGAVSGTTGTFTGAVSGTTGTFTGAVSGTTGTFTGAVSGTTGTFTGQATIPTINLTGGQITFPATQSASSDANTLDDYEEGDWTPALTAGAGSITSYTSVGKYTKVGRMVTCNCFVNITNNGSGASGGYLSGLPFATANAGVASCTRDYAATGKIGIVQFLMGAVSGYVIATDGTYPWASGSAFNFSFSYQI